jgi:NAD(P)H dehydrogenase (quinone)
MWRRRAHAKRIAVTGSTGRVGRRVVQLLAESGRHRVVALTRRPLPRPHAGAQESEAVTVARADYSDVASLRSALRGADVLVFVSSDGEAARVIVHHQNVVRAARDAGVGHVVYLSGLDADLESPFCYAYTNGYTEQLLVESFAGSGCAVSIARASIYTEFLLGFLERARDTGEIRLPAGDGRLSLVSREDVARCLAALAGVAPTGRHHDVTGPDSLDLATVAAVTGRAWRTPLRYTDVPPGSFGAELAAEGEDPWWIYAFSTMFASVRDQRWASVSDEVTQLTGRPPRSLPHVLEPR